MIKPLDPIPNGWKHQLIDTLAKRGSGHTPDRAKPEYWDGGVKWVSLTDSDKLDRRWIKDTASEISALGIRHSSAVLHPENTVILSRDAGVGKSAILAQPMAVSQHFIAWRCGPELVPYVLYYWLQYHKAFFERMAVGSTIQTIGLGVFKKLAGTFPPLPEQRKIADILTTWDEALAQLDALIEAQERRKKALMQQLLTGKERFPGFKGKWKTVNLGDVLEPITRPTAKPQSKFLAAGIRSHGKGVFLKHDFIPANIALDELFELKTGDLVVNITFAWEGAAAIVPPEADGALVSHRFPAFGFREGKAARSFFRHYIRTHRFVFDCGLASPGGAGRNRVLSKSAFLDIELPLPPIKEQQKIGDILDTADQQLTLLRAQRTALDQQKRGLMQRLLTGKLRVKI